jgi:hypothetical protein
MFKTAAIRRVVRAARTSVGAGLVCSVLLASGNSSQIASAAGYTLSFTSTATVSPTQVMPGAQVSIASTFTAMAARSNVTLDVEVYNSANTKIYQKLFPSQTFAAGKSQAYTAAWVVPAAQPLGTYTVKLGAFSSDFATGYGWNDNAASLVVGRPSFTSTASLDRSSLAPGGSVTISSTFKSTLAASNILLDVEVRDSANISVYQQLFQSQTFSAGTSRAFASTWAVPASQAPGTYTVKLGAYSAGFQTNYGWNASAATVSVGSGQPSFTSTGTAGSVAPGGSATISATFVSATAASNVTNDVEVRDGSNTKIYQQQFLNQSFTAGQSRTFTAAWVVPAGQTPGTYTVVLGAFSADLKTTYGWNANAAQVKVTAAAGRTYYVDCSGSDTKAGLDPSTAWATLAKASQASLQPGDSVLLKRGCSWNGPFNPHWNGTAAKPITIGAYGTGALPHIGGTAATLISITGSYQVLDSLALSSPADRFVAVGTCSAQPVGDHTGIEMSPGGSHNTVQNSDFTSLSVGIKIIRGATYNSIAHNVLHKVNMMFTLTPSSVNADDDAGGQNILLEGDYNDIGYNRIVDAYACGYDYNGANGQAIVVYGGSHNVIHHSFATNDQNFAEVGSCCGAGEVPANDNTFAYNVSIGQQFLSVHGHGDHWGPALNNKLYNNTSYNTGNGGVSCFGCGTDVLTMRNNIIWSTTGLDVGTTPINESNNLFWSTAYGPSWNSIKLSPTDVVADPKLTNPGSGDFHLTTGSLAIDKGSADSVTAGFSRDMDGTLAPQRGGIDIGAYEAH